MAPRNRPKHHNALIVCTPGLEEVVLEELAELGVKTATRDGKGAVIATLSTRELYAANALLRSATRILVRAFSFKADTFAGLESEIQRLDWSPYVSDQPLNFVVSSHASALYHTKAIQERLQRWVPSGPPNFVPGDDDPALRVVVRAVDDIFTVRIDTSGDELYRRGWRPESAKMGLRESVAAAVVRRSGWDQASPLLDPCCGSGTVAIEAALQAAGAPPHDLQRRGFALQLWPSFDERAWDAVEDDVAAKAEAARAAPAAAPLVFASDRDAGAVRAARANARRAGVADRIEFRQEPVTEAGARAAETAAAASFLRRPSAALRRCAGSFAMLSAMCFSTTRSIFGSVSSCFSQNCAASAFGSSPGDTWIVPWRPSPIATFILRITFDLPFCHRSVAAPLLPAEEGAPPSSDAARCVLAWVDGVAWSTAGRVVVSPSDVGVRGSEDGGSAAMSSKIMVRKGS